MHGLTLWLMVGAVVGLTGCGGADCGEGTHDENGTCVPDEAPDTGGHFDGDGEKSTVRIVAVNPGQYAITVTIGHHNGTRWIRVVAVRASGGSVTVGILGHCSTPGIVVVAVFGGDDSVTVRIDCH